MNTKSYKVVINNEEYNLVSDEGEARVAEAAKMVDTIIQQLSKQAPSLDKRKIAVLAALQIASTVLQHQDVIAQRSQLEDNLVSLIDSKLLSL